MKKPILLSLFISFCSLALANNMLVQNVTTTGNNAGVQTIQVQFDISWDNSWRDAINWDAAWIFMKFKDANGLWQHCKLNQTGFTNGSGTANTVQVTSDKVGSWLYRSAQGAGTFNTTGMQLQWNYGLSGLTDVTGLEVRVFAVEMVYVPEGEFNVAKNFYYDGAYFFNGSINAPGSNFPVINTKLSPTLTYSDGTSDSIRIKGDAGIDTNNDGVIDNTTYPIGYRAFYCYKYELTEQQYADFLNTLTPAQVSTLGIAGSSITLSVGQYFSSTPNRVCGNSNAIRLFAIADWAGLRPMSLLEMNKASYGPLQPVAGFFSFPDLGYPAWGSENGPGLPINNSNGNQILQDVGYNGNVSSTRSSSGSSYYGIMDLTWNVREPVIRLSDYFFNSTNGNGVLTVQGLNDISSWQEGSLLNWEQAENFNFNEEFNGFRYVRSAE